MDLYDELAELEAKIAKWEADDVYPGDRGYQDMLERRDTLKEKIKAENESPLA